jgi:hypothetical protein
MSNNENNSRQGLDEAKKEEIHRLIQKLSQKYKLDNTGQAEPAKTAVAQTIAQEIADNTFIDIPEFVEKRSRYIEQKYGLKPMNEILAPKSDDQKRKELEEYLKKNNNPLLGDALKKTTRAVSRFSDHMSREMAEIQREENAPPVQYKWFEDLPGYKPEVNIGQKWADAFEVQVKKEAELNTALRRGGYHYAAWKKGRIGVDKYFILFGLFGAFLLPLYIYNRHKTYKEYIMQERGLKPDDEIDLENGPFELDEISYHKAWDNDPTERKKNLIKLSRKIEIRKLEEEIYGPEAFGASVLDDS